MASDSHRQDKHEAGRPGEEPGPATLVEQGTAAHLAGDTVRAVGLLQRAYRAYLEEDERSAQAVPTSRTADEALRVAFLLAMVFGTTGQPAQFNGWLARARRLLAESHPDQGPAPSLGRGFVAVLELHQALESGGFGQIGSLAAEAIEAGLQHREPDLLALGLVAQGRFTIYTGEVPRGLSLLDEAMTCVLTGETGGLVTGLVWCAAIEGCQEIGAVDRLFEWTTALNTWCADQPGLAAFSGRCSLHTGQVLTMQGHWVQADREFAAARARFERSGVMGAAGSAERERGDLFRRRGEPELAEAAYLAAAEHGCDPQPGLALLWLSRGQQEAASAAIERCLSETMLPAQRIGLLPSAIEAVLALGHGEEAEHLLTELDDLAGMTGCAPVVAAAAHGHARVELARDDPGGALPYARKALQVWDAVGCPFEVAQSRLTLARALAGLGDHQSCRGELEAARSAFAALGAGPSVTEAESLRRSLLQDHPDLPAPQSPDGLTARELEVLHLVAAGRSNRQIAAELVISEKTVARHLSNIFTKIDVGSRTSAAAYAFEHGLA